MAKRPRRSSKPRKAVRPPVIDLKAEETKSAEEAKDAEATKATPEMPKAAKATPETPKAAKDAPKSATAGDDVKKPSTGKPKAGSGGPTPKVGAPVAAAANNRGKMIAGGLALLVLAAIAFGGWLYRDYGSKFFGSVQIAALTAIEDRLAALEAAAKANAGKLDVLGAGVSAAEQKIAALEASAGTGQGVAPEELAAVQKSVAELRSALSSASGQENSAGQAANKIEIDKLSSELAGIGDRIGKAETAIAAVKPVDTSGLESKLAGLEAELASLKAQQSQLATQTRSELGEAFAILSGKVAGSGPFGAELDALAAEAPAVPGIVDLRSLATTGVTSIEDLAKALESMKIPADKSAAAGEETAGSGLMGALKARLSTVVKIRKLDEADWPAVLKAAAKQVRDGQLDQALAFLASQPGEAPESMADWRNQAEARAEAERAMDVLSKAVLSRLAATGHSG